MSMGLGREWLWFGLAVRYYIEEMVIKETTVFLLL